MDQHGVHDLNFSPPHDEDGDVEMHNEHVQDHHDEHVQDQPAGTTQLENYSSVGKVHCSAHAKLRRKLVHNWCCYLCRLAE